MLVRLLYASRAAENFDGANLLAILRQSRAKNPKLGITGVLCHSQGLFMQVLEGGRGAVNALYAQILTDPRHHDVQLLRYEEIGERRFSGWSMGQVYLAKLNRGLLLKYAETETLDPFTLSGASALALFDDLLATAAVVGQST